MSIWNFDSGFFCPVTALYLFAIVRIVFFYLELQQLEIYAGIFMYENSLHMAFRHRKYMTGYIFNTVAGTWDGS
jgi:hypothetical protein